MRKILSSIWGALATPRTAATGPQQTPAPIRRGPVLWLVLSGVLLIAAIMIGTAAMVSEFRERALSNSERELENTVRLLSRHFDQQFEDCEIISTRPDRPDAVFRRSPRPRSSESRMSTFDAHLALKSRVSALSYIGDVNIFDSDGHADQLVGAMAGTRRRHRRPGLFQVLQIEPAIDAGAGRTGSQYLYRRLDHGDRPSPERAGRGFLWA